MSAITLKFIGPRPFEIAPGTHVLLCVVRNESLRLPYFLAYYRNLGFDRFIFIDNGSTDGTREFLLDQPDTSVFYTEARFGSPRPGSGVHWKNALLDRFCNGTWVLVMDADELLVWPGSEGETIRTLTRTFDACGAEVMFTVMLDMYSDKPFGEIGYRAGLPFLDYAPYFDCGPYTVLPMRSFPHRRVDGGVRARLYRAGAGDLTAPIMSKVPLLKWRAGQRFVISQHALLNPAPLAPMQGALLHFKMFDDLPAKCEVEAERGEYYKKGLDYRVLGAAIGNSGGKSFFDPAIALRYENTAQLVALGLIGPLVPDPMSGTG